MSTDNSKDIAGQSATSSSSSSSSLSSSSSSSPVHYVPGCVSLVQTKWSLLLLLLLLAAIFATITCFSKIIKFSVMRMKMIKMIIPVVKMKTMICPGSTLLVQRHSPTPTRCKLGPDSCQLSLQVIIVIFAKSH